MWDYDADEVRNLMKEAKECLPDLAEANDKFDEAESSFNRLIESYEDKISELESDVQEKDDEIAGLEAQLAEIESAGELEESATAILTYYTGHDPSLGDVLSLKEDIAKLLKEKYHVSSGELD